MSQPIPKDTLMMLKEVNICLVYPFIFYNTNAVFTNLQTVQLGKQTIYDCDILHSICNLDQNNSWLSLAPPMDQRKGLGGVNSDTDDCCKRACGCDHTCSLRRGCTHVLPCRDSSKTPYDNAA